MPGSLHSSRCRQSAKGISVPRGKSTCCVARSRCVHTVPRKNATLRCGACPTTLDLEVPSLPASSLLRTRIIIILPHRIIQNAKTCVAGLESGRPPQGGSGEDGAAAVAAAMERFIRAVAEDSPARAVCRGDLDRIHEAQQAAVAQLEELRPAVFRTSAELAAEAAALRALIVKHAK